MEASNLGHGNYKGGAEHYHSITENLAALKDKYEYEDGYFGEQSPGHNADKRIIASNNPLMTAEDFYDTGAHGGIERMLDNGKGVRTDMADGTTFTFREVSGSPDRSPAVSISIRRSTNTGGVKTQKIHFVQGGER